MQRGLVGKIGAAGHVDLRVVVGDQVGGGEHRRRIDRQELDRRRPRAVEPVVGGDDVDMGFAVLAAPAEVAVEIAQLGGLHVAPAALLQTVGRGIGGDPAALDAVLEFALIFCERAAEEVNLAALIGEAVLHLHRKRAAQRVQPEDRVRADEVHPVDRQIRDQVPVHRFAERLVEARAVQVNREPLRVALQRRRLEPVVEQARLKRVAGGRVERDPRNLFVQRAQRVGVAAAGDVGPGQHLGLRRHLGAVHPRSEQRRRRDHFYRRKGDFRSRRRRGLRCDHPRQQRQDQRDRQNPSVERRPGMSPTRPIDRSGRAPLPPRHCRLPARRRGSRRRIVLCPTAPRGVKATSRAKRSRAGRAARPGAHTE